MYFYINFLLLSVICTFVSSHIIYTDDNERAALTDKKWPDNTIPYSWHDSIDPERKRLITDAFTDIMKVVPNCWKFVKRTNEKHWVEFKNTQDSCFSYLGYLGGRYRPPQIINFGGEACNPGGMIHELYHTIGITHEFQRDDRDYFVRINWDNILPKYQNNYRLDRENRDNTEWFGLPYNFKSIMQYAFYVGEGVVNSREPVMINMRNKSALNWDIDDWDVGQAFFLTRQDIQILALRGGCKVPPTERYNITNAKPTDRGIGPASMIKEDENQEDQNQQHNNVELSLNLKFKK